MVALLLEFGANVDASSESGLTPLGYAAAAGYLSIVVLLCKKRAKVTAAPPTALPPSRQPCAVSLMGVQAEHTKPSRVQSTGSPGPLLAHLLLPLLQRIRTRF